MPPPPPQVLLATTVQPLVVQWSGALAHGATLLDPVRPHAPPQTRATWACALRTL